MQLQNQTAAQEHAAHTTEDTIITDKQSPEALKVEPDLAKTNELKTQGNSIFTEGKYTEAIQIYLEATKYCPPEDNKLLCILYTNTSVCYNKLGDHERVIEYGKLAVQKNPEWRKAHLLMGQSYESTDKPDEALESFKKAQAIQSDQHLQVKIKDLQKKVEALNEKRKEEVMSGLKNIGNSILGYFGMSLDNFKLQKNENGSYNISMNQ